MVNYLEILRLSSLGYNQRTIEATAHSSRHTVRSVLQAAQANGIAWPLDGDITNADLEALRDQKFFSIREMNEAIAEKLEALNNRPFQKMQGRAAVRLSERRKADMMPLPATPLR